MQGKKEGTKAHRHEGTKWGPGKEGPSAKQNPHSSDLPQAPFRAFVPTCLLASDLSPPPTPHFPPENQPFSAHICLSRCAVSRVSAIGTTAHKLRDPVPTPP